MKWFVYLFSCYVLFLSGVPCNASDDCCQDEMSCNRPVEKQQNDQPHKPSCPCSPFFACSTCAGAIPASILIQFTQVFPSGCKPQPFYTESKLLDFAPAIWQPPKMD